LFGSVCNRTAGYADEKQMGVYVLHGLLLLTRAKSDAKYASVMRQSKNAYRMFLENRATWKAGKEVNNSRALRDTFWGW